MSSQLTRDIHQIKVPIPNNELGFTNVYLLRGEDGYLMIDTGWNGDDSFNSLCSQLDELHVGFGDIKQIIVTHHHRDHYGLVRRIKERCSAAVSLHQDDMPMIVNEANGIENAHQALEEVQHWLHTNGVPEQDLPPANALLERLRTGFNFPHPDIQLHGDETISTGNFNLKVLHTPGHAPGHVCLFEESKGILFAGDHVLPIITPNISLHPRTPEANPLGDFIKSLNKVAELDAGLVLPAHQNTFSGLRKRVAELKQHHEVRNSEILKAMKDNPRTAYQISAEITWMPESGGVKWKNLAPWDRRLALAETLAHLEAMRLDGSVEMVPQNSLILYKQT
jgi:glyoxylase-like metal-dependent hydrolase (beta-lactamase superfamily II)